MSHIGLGQHLLNAVPFIIQENYMKTYVIVGLDYGTQEPNCFGVFTEDAKAEDAKASLEADGIGTGLCIVPMELDEEI